MTITEFDWPPPPEVVWMVVIDLPHYEKYRTIYRSEQRAHYYRETLVSVRKHFAPESVRVIKELFKDLPQYLQDQMLPNTDEPADFGEVRELVPNPYAYPYPPTEDQALRHIN